MLHNIVQKLITVCDKENKYCCLNCVKFEENIAKDTRDKDNICL